MCTLGPRESRTPLRTAPVNLAVVDVLNRRVAQSPFRSVHGLAKALPDGVAQPLYLLLRGRAIINLAELFAICEALRVPPRQVLAEAESRRGERGWGGGVRRAPPDRGRAGRARGAVRPTGERGCRRAMAASAA